MKKRNYTVIYKLAGDSFPLAFTTIHANAEGAARACRLNHPSAQVFGVIRLPAKAPARFNQPIL